MLLCLWMCLSVDLSTCRPTCLRRLASCHGLGASHRPFHIAPTICAVQWWGISSRLLGVILDSQLVQSMPSSQMHPPITSDHPIGQPNTQCLSVSL